MKKPLYIHPSLTGRRKPWTRADQAAQRAIDDLVRITLAKIPQESGRPTGVGGWHPAWSN